MHQKRINNESLALFIDTRRWDLLRSKINFPTMLSTLYIWASEIFTLTLQSALLFSWAFFKKRPSKGGSKGRENYDIRRQNRARILTFSDNRNIGINMKYRNDFGLPGWLRKSSLNCNISNAILSFLFIFFRFCSASFRCFPWQEERRMWDISSVRINQPFLTYFCIIMIFILICSEIRMAECSK